MAKVFSVTKGGGGSGTVTNVSSANADATIANPTTTPVITIVTAPNLSGTPTVPNGTAAATQSAADNSTKLATTAYTDTAITNSISATQTLTNKRITRRVLSLSAGSATPAINTDSYDVVHITAQSAAITSFTTNLTGTPVDGDTLRISITDDGSARALTFGTSFASSGTVSLPTTTVLSVRLDIGFFWDTVATKWRCIAVA